MRYVFPFAVDEGHNLITDITIGQLLAAVTTLLVIGALVRKVSPIMKRVNNLLDDWFGEQARPGVKERKGVMERMGDQDAAIEEIRTDLAPLTDANHNGNHAEVLKRLDDADHVAKANTSHLRIVERLLQRHIRESKQWIKDINESVRERDPEFRVPPWPSVEEDDGDDKR